MKIKEVIVKTGLTDKAIRLYINEGLAVPNIEENHSGRKSIEFSDSDVERLNNVAMLRKAGFSIADIKSIVENKETKAIIEKYIGETETEIGYKTEIVEKLKNISFDEEVTLETICNSLSATVEEAEVPSEDLNLSLKDKIKKWLFITFACSQLIISIDALILIFKSVFDYRYPNISEKGIFFLVPHAVWLVIIAVSAIIIRINIKKNNVVNKKTNRICFLLSCLTIVSGLIMTPISFLLILVQPVYSQTTNPDNYLIFDSWPEEEMKEVCYFFPQEIPESAVNRTKGLYEKDYPYTTKYFYRYNCNDDFWYTSYDVFAEWVLPANEYEKAKEAVSDKNGYIIERGDWDLKYISGLSEEFFFDRYIDEFATDNWDGERYDYMIFAYNDKTNKVRYIATASLGFEDVGPYHLSLEW